MAILVAALGAGCGKKGPPLPPLVRLPVAPAEIVAERRGPAVEIRFLVPNANTDGSRPANVERVDVYAVTGEAAFTDEELIERGERVGSVDVKAPVDPDDTVEADEPEEDAVPPEGPGLDQGAPGHVSETVEAEEAGAPFEVPRRTYLAVGVNQSGRRGPPSPRVSVPLVLAPEPASEPAVRWNETAVTVTWPAPGPGAEPPAGAGDLLPSTPIGLTIPRLKYNVYELTLSKEGDPEGPAGATVAAGGAIVERRLTPEPIAERQYVDSRIEWDAERCYTVTVVHEYERLRVESPTAPPRCVTLADTFPPAAPAGLRAIGTEGGVSLIWSPSPEKDAVGYIVLRGAPGGQLTPATGAPVPQTSYEDKAPAGTRLAYAVQAVDKAGNRSAPSAPVIETAR